MELIEKAKEAYHKNFDSKAWYGRCIFLSWYCELGTCKFCFRSTQKHRIRYSKNAMRTKESVAVEALLAKKLGWRIEFLTGGYGIYSQEQMLELIDLVRKVYGKKIWLNLGALEKAELETFKPHIGGLAASIECINPELHKEICPDKPIAPYEKMFENAPELKKSITIVIGLGEKREDFSLLSDFIRKHGLDRITFYALKPVKGTMFENAKPLKTEDYLWWIAKTRTEFPNMEIIAGTTARRYKEVGRILEAGANAFTKFPATRMFGTREAKQIETDIKDIGREMEGTITKLPDIDWDHEVEKLDIEENLKIKVKKKLAEYLERMKKI